MSGNTWLILDLTRRRFAAQPACQDQPASRIGARGARTRWDAFPPQEDVEDDRRQPAGAPAAPAGVAGGLGLGTINSIIGLISGYFGIDPSALLDGVQIHRRRDADQHGAASGATAPPRDRPATSSPSSSAIPKTAGKRYSPPRTHRSSAAAAFVDASSDACAFARSAMGPLIARTIGASISTSPSSRICRTSSAPAPTARPASSRRPT